MNASRIIRLFILMFISIVTIGNAQETEDAFAKLQQNLMDSFLGPLEAEGKDITSADRANFMGYLLNRQSQYNGSFEMDIIRLHKLEDKVRAFLLSLSSEEDLLSELDMGMSGKLDHRIESMLGGSPYVEPMFTSLEDVSDRWRDVEYSAQAFQNYSEKAAVTQCVESIIALLRENNYREIEELSGGRFHDQFREWRWELGQDPDEKAKWDEFFRSFQITTGTPEMSATDPPMVRIPCQITTPDGDVDESPILLILDNGVWKTFRFMD